MSRTKLKQTLTAEQTISLLNGGIVGLFTTAILSTDSYYKETQGLCLEYYLSRSANKAISATYRNIKAFVENNTDTVTQTTDELIGTICRNKFSYKWDKIYTALLNSDYDPTRDYEYYESRVSNGTDSSQRSNTSSTTDEYTGNTTDNGKKGTNTTVTTDSTNGVVTEQEVTSDNTDENNTYGFNSTTPVGADNSLSSSTEKTSGTENTTTGTTEKTVGLLDENLTQNIQDKTSTDTKSVSESGSDSSEYNHTDTINKHGRNATAQELLQKELDLREKNIFYNIVLSDIDTIVTSQIY